MKVVWTQTAIEHLVSIYEYVARDSQTYALRMIDRLTRRTEQIGLFPESGRTVSEFDSPEVREVFESPYRIIYRIRPDQIDVVAVLHAARRISDE